MEAEPEKSLHLTKRDGNSDNERGFPITARPYPGYMNSTTFQAKGNRQERRRFDSKPDTISFKVEGKALGQATIRRLRKWSDT